MLAAHLFCSYKHHPLLTISPSFLDCPSDLSGCYSNCHLLVSGCKQCPLVSITLMPHTPHVDIRDQAWEPVSCYDPWPTEKIHLYFSVMLVPLSPAHSSWPWLWDLIIWWVCWPNMIYPFHYVIPLRLLFLSLPYQGNSGMSTSLGIDFEFSTLNSSLGNALPVMVDSKM